MLVGACQLARRRVFARSVALPEGAVEESLVPPGESHTHSSGALGSALPASPASPWCRTRCEMLHASINFSYCMVPAPQLLGAEGPQQGQQHPAPAPWRCPHRDTRASAPHQGTSRPCRGLLWLLSHSTTTFVAPCPSICRRV